MRFYVKLRHQNSLLWQRKQDFSPHKLYFYTEYQLPRVGLFEQKKLNIACGKNQLHQVAIQEKLKDSFKKRTTCFVSFFFFSHSSSFVFRHENIFRHVFRYTKRMNFYTRKKDMVEISDGVRSKTTCQKKMGSMSFKGIRNRCERTL